MDIFSLINSKDIREYLKEKNYNFSTLETAWLVYACRKLSYDEKKKYWNEIVSTMPDCEVPSRMNCLGWSSLHLFLSQYMEIMDSEIKKFFENKTENKYVYMYSYLYKGDDEWTEEYEHIYNSLEKCINAYKEDVADLDETYSPNETGVLRYRIKRQSLDDSFDVMEIECFGNDQVVDVIRNSKRAEEADTILNNSFEGLWFDFPTPFKKGDVVWVPSEENRIRWDCDGGFVLRGLSTWNPSKFMLESGDNSDMNGFGYFVNPNGTVYHEVMCNYMDLEYYPGPYKLNERILPALGKFLKGEIEVDLLLCAYRKTLIDVAADDVMLKSWYSEDMLKDIGLI